MHGGRCGSSGARGSDDGLLLSLTPFQAGLLSAMLSPLKTQLAVICLCWKEQAFPLRWAMYQWTAQLQVLTSLALKFSIMEEVAMPI